MPDEHCADFATRPDIEVAYLDTSLLVAALTPEAHTATAQEWLADQTPEQLVISEWTATEFSAALSMKVRMRHLDESARSEVLAVFNTMKNETFEVLAVKQTDFVSAARLADHHESGLRAGDALHLGIAANATQQIVSLDKTLVDAALAAGIAARLL